METAYAALGPMVVQETLEGTAFRRQTCFLEMVEYFGDGCAPA